MYIKKSVSLALVVLLISSALVGMIAFLPQESKGTELADSPWPCHGQNNKNTGRSPYETSHIDGTEKWNFTTKGQVYSPAIGEDGTIYFGSGTGNLFAIGEEEDGDDEGIPGFTSALLLSAVILTLAIYRKKKR